VSENERRLREWIERNARGASGGGDIAGLRYLDRVIEEKHAEGYAEAKAQAASIACDDFDNGDVADAIRAMEPTEKP